jgi:hypothetical protein
MDSIDIELRRRLAGLAVSFLIELISRFRSHQCSELLGAYHHAQAMRAILLASATAATLIGLAVLPGSFLTSKNVLFNFLAPTFFVPCGKAISRAAAATLRLASTTSAISV